MTNARGNQNTAKHWKICWIFNIAANGKLEIIIRIKETFLPPEFNSKAWMLNYPWVHSRNGGQIWSICRWLFLSIFKGRFVADSILGRLSPNNHSCLKRCEPCQNINLIKCCLLRHIRYFFLYKWIFNKNMFFILNKNLCDHIGGSQPCLCPSPLENFSMSSHPHKSNK